jgi:hypothetical protein
MVIYMWWVQFIDLAGGFIVRVILSFLRASPEVVSVSSTVPASTQHNKRTGMSPPKLVTG